MWSELKAENTNEYLKWSRIEHLYINILFACFIAFAINMP